VTHTSRVAWFDGPESGFRLTDVELPPLAHGEVLVEISAAAICGSDLHTVTGRRPAHVPIVLGHEILGRVVDVAGDITCHDGEPLVPGDRVTWTIMVSCQSCFFCNSGLPQKCLSLIKYGHADSTLPGPLGGFATHCRLLPGTAIFRVPDTLADAEAVPANCCTATSIAAFEACGDAPLGNLLILGAGALGVTLSEIAFAKHVGTVFLCDSNTDRLNRITPQPGLVALAANDLVGGMPETISDATQGRGVDAVIDVTGVPEAIENGLACLRIGGTAVLVGSVFASRPIPLSTEQVVRNLWTITGVHNYAPHHLAAALQFLAEQPAGSMSRSLATSECHLEDLEGALETAKSLDHYRVMVTPQAGQAR